MAGREVREYTNLTDPRDRKWAKGKDKIDDEEVTFQRMVAKMQEVAGDRGGYLHGRGALDSDDLLYLKEQMEAEEDAERLLRRTEKRAFAAFKKAASLADSSPTPLPAPLRMEPKPKSGIRQLEILKNLVEIKPKRPKVSSPSLDDNKASAGHPQGNEAIPSELPSAAAKTEAGSVGKGLLGLAYESSDED
ncbi:ankyrin repeat protein [Wolffia australiana]